MNTVLYIVLGIVLGVVLTPLLLWIAFKLFVHFFFKKLMKAFGQMGGGVPPMRLEVDPVDEDHEWIDAKLVERLTKELEKHGFQQAGDYELLVNPMVCSRAYANPESHCYALLHDWDREMLPNMGVVVDLFAETVPAENGAEKIEYTVSNAPKTALEKPPWAEKVNLDIDINNAGLAIGALVERMQQLTEGVNLKPASTDRFVDDLKGQYNREMDWYIDRGGPAKDELRRNLLLMGGEDQDEEAIEEAVELSQTQWGIAIDNFVSEEIRKRFLKHVTKMSAGEWEEVRDRLYVVHEKSHPTLLIGRVSSELFPDDPEDDADYEEIEASLNQQLEPLFTGTPPREAFEQALEMLPEGRSFKRLARIKSPWSADIYLEPESED